VKEKGGLTIYEEERKRKKSLPYLDKSLGLARRRRRRKSLRGKWRKKRPHQEKKRSGHTEDRKKGKREEGGVYLFRREGKKGVLLLSTIPKKGGGGARITSKGKGRKRGLFLLFIRRGGGPLDAIGRKLGGIPRKEPGWKKGRKEKKIGSGKGTGGGLVAKKKGRKGGTCCFIRRKKKNLFFREAEQPDRERGKKGKEWRDLGREPLSPREGVCSSRGSLPVGGKKEDARERIPSFLNPGGGAKIQPA